MTWREGSRELDSTGKKVLLPLSRWFLLVWLILPLPHLCILRAPQALYQPYRWQCHGLLTIPGRQLPKQLLPCKSLEQVWHVFSHLALPELDTLSSCLWFTPAKVIKVVCCKGWFRVQCWDTAPASTPLLQAGEKSRKSNP